MVDDEALDPRGRMLLAAYRGETGPSPAQVERLLAAVRHSAATAGAEEPRPRSVSRAAIVGAGLLAAAALAAFAWLGGAASPQRRVDAGAAADHGKTDTGGGRAEVAPAAPGPAPERAVDEPPPADPEPARARPVRREPAPTVEPPEPGEPRTDALAGELAFVREVHALLAAGDPARALARVEAYPGSHPAGLLREEVAALRVIALCGLRREAGEAAAFAGEYPRSLFAGRVRRACGAADENPAERTPTSP